MSKGRCSLIFLIWTAQLRLTVATCMPSLRLRIACLTTWYLGSRRVERQNFKIWWKTRFEAPKSQFFLQKSRKFAKTGQTPITQVGQTELINGAVQTVKLYEAVLLVVATNKANVKMSVMNETIKAVESIVEHGGESYTYKLTTLKKKIKFHIKNIFGYRARCETKFWFRRAILGFRSRFWGFESPVLGFRSRFFVAILIFRV